MKTTWVISAALLLVATPATASSTMCTFTVPSGSSAYDLEFLGYGEIQQILFRPPGSDGPKSLPSGSYQVIKFQEKTRTIDLTYRNPGTKGLLPSLTLRGVGKSTVMEIAGKTIVGDSTATTNPDDSLDSLSMQFFIVPNTRTQQDPLLA